MEKEVNFSLSPSSINLYNESQLIFYYTYLMKAPPDTKVTQCYGVGGSLVHDLLEKAALEENYEMEESVFIKEWVRKKLNTMPGVNGVPMDYRKYYLALTNGLNLLKYKYKNAKPEESIEWDILNKPGYRIRCKGIIDLQCEENGEYIIVDWKTSSSVDTGNNFALQGKHYAYMVWKKYGKLPKKIVFEYVKIGKKAEYSFTDKDMIEHEEYLINLANEIYEKQFDINKFEIGSIEGIFNQHKKKCFDEKRRRENKTSIFAEVFKNKLILRNVPMKLRVAMNKKYAYRVPGYQWTEMFKKRLWDGYKRFVKINEDNITIPYAFINDFKRMLKDYNKYYKADYTLMIEDSRNAEIVDKTYDTKFRDSDIELRDYQEEAIKVMLQKKIGIIYGGCGFGKTLASAEFIKKTNRRTLFLINRIELIEQTKEAFEDYLGVECGMMTEGNLDTSKQITIASIQTLYAILKRKDETTKKLMLYLHNITCMIYDECHQAKNSGMYNALAKRLNNLMYCVGLSGSPERGDETLEMNVLVGFVEYSKSAKSLIKEGYLVPAQNYFVRYMSDEEINEDTYANYYTKYIVESEKRNKLIAEIAKRFLEKNKKVLIITRRVKHIEILRDLIGEGYCISGSTNKTQRREMFEAFKNGEKGLLIGSSPIFSVGINIPNLDVIINTVGGKSENEVIQTIGRVLRKMDNKKFGYYVDIFDDDEEYFNQAVHDRMASLTKYGFTSTVVNKPDSIDIS